jgi:hypothetical protein
MRGEKAFKQASPLIKKALAYQDTHTIDDVERELLREKAQLWCGDTSIIVTEIGEFPLGNKVRIWLAAGDMEELVDEMLPEIESWAKDQNCVAVTIVGRKGWLRKLKSVYKQNYVMLERKI